MRKNGTCCSLTDVIVAPCGYNKKLRRYVDFICAGENDEKTIQAAVEKAVMENKNVYLLNGVYKIDSVYDFGDGGPHAAICIPTAHREISIIGQNHEYGFQKKYDDGVVLYVSEKALSIADEKTSDVIRGGWTDRGIQNGSSLRIENVAVVLANNQHPVRCIDLRRVDRVEVKNISLIAYGDLVAPDSDYGLGTPPPMPAEGCIGLTMTDGSNYDYSNYTNVQTWGFYEGIQVGGEHVVCINCGTAIGYYGWTFGNYEINCGANHPITLINCMDERNVNLPLFNMCGDSDWDGNRLQGLQEVTMISFNIERVEKQVPGGKFGNVMREVYPGTWRGTIEFTAQPDWCHLNEVSFKLWEDGSGRNIRTRNVAHKDVCTTEERLSYYPSFGQQIFDTDLNKMVICTDPEKRKWVDFAGDEV